MELVKRHFLQVILNTSIWELFARYCFFYFWKNRKPEPLQVKPVDCENPENAEKSSQRNIVSAKLYVSDM